MPPTIRLISLKRLGPSPSRTMIRMLHLSPTRASTELTARQSSLSRAGSSTATSVCFGTKSVPSCELLAAATILVWVTILYHQKGANHDRYRGDHREHPP